MNNTTKAKYEVATRMLKGKIDVDEVAMMTGLPLLEIEKLKEEVTPNESEVEILKNLDTVDFNVSDIIFDDSIAADELR